MLRFVRDERGALAVLGAVMISALLGLGAIAVDVSNAYATHAKLQAAADAAALAATQALPNTAGATAAALDIAAKNAPAGYGTIVQTSDVVLGSYDPATATFTPGGAIANAVQVTTGRTAAHGNAPRLFLATILGRSASDIRASATAFRAPSTCVYVLNSSNSSGALSLQGGGDFNVPNCGVWVNSRHNHAASSSGASTARARSFCIRGSYTGNFTAPPTTGCPVAPDPLASLREPVVADLPGAKQLCKTPLELASTTWTEGRYCGYGGTITLPANTTLSAGLYFFENATLSIGSSVNLNAQGVTLYFDANSTLSHTSSGIVSVTAATSGTWKGISLFQSRSAPSNNVIRLTGNADFTFDGTLYIPRAQLQMTGNSSVASKAGYVIAYEMQYTGSSNFTIGTWGGAQASLNSSSPPTLVQ